MNRVIAITVVAVISTLFCFCISGCEQQKKTVFLLTYEDGHATDYIYSNHEFDKSGNLISVQRNEANSKKTAMGNTDVFIKYEYRSDGTLEKETRSHEFESLYSNYVEEFTYDEYGNEIKQVDGDCNIVLTTVNTYEGNQLASSITTSDNSNSWYKNEYSYSEDGKIESKTELLSIDGDSTIDSSFKTTFTYDDNGNVVKRSVQQTYDREGGSLSKWVETLTYEEKDL